MFTENPNLLNPAKGVYWYKGFFTPEEVEKFNNIINSKELEYDNPYFDNIEFKSTSIIPELHEVWEKISAFMYPEFVIHPMLTLLRYDVGTIMVPHSDSPGEDHPEELTVPDLWGTCHLLSWGVCTYFGDFTGGEVEYPNQDLVVPVQPGDLVIHGALAENLHGVKEVKSGVRYCYSNFSLKAEKNPGSFYNYKTDEYYESVKDLEKWMTPLFENPRMAEIKSKTDAGKTALEIN